MFAYMSLARLARPVCAAGAASPLRYLQGSVGQNNSCSFVMEGAQGASNNSAKHKKRKFPVQRWRPISTEAVSRKADLEDISNSGSNTTKVVIEDSMEVTGFNKDLDGFNISEKYSSSVEVDAPLMRFLKGKGGSMQKQIEQETGVKITFPSSKQETLVVLEGKSAESIRKASERIAKALEEAVQSPMLDYSHFISLPLAIHPNLVEKLNHFQSSILGASASNVNSDKDGNTSEGSIDEIDQAEGPSVSMKLRVQEEESLRVKMDNKGSQSGLKVLLIFFKCIMLLLGVIPTVNTINFVYGTLILDLCVCLKKLHESLHKRCMIGTYALDQ